MAKATYKPVVPAPEPTAVTLELTLQEAIFLHDLVGAGVIGPHDSRRKHADDIFNALHELKNLPSYEKAKDFTGMITFTKEKQ